MVDVKEEQKEWVQRQSAVGKFHDHGAVGIPFALLQQKVEQLQRLEQIPWVKNNGVTGMSTMDEEKEETHREGPGRVMKQQNVWKKI